MEATYKSGRALAIATVMLLIVPMLLLVARTALYYVTMRELGTFDADGAGRRLALFTLIRWSAVVAYVATTVVFLMWVYRATANLPALGARSTRFTPARAVKVLIIPLVNLVCAYPVMAMIWRESQPRTLSDAGYFKPRSIFIVIFWYALLLGSIVLAVLLRVLPHTTGADATLQKVLLFFDGATDIVFGIMVYTADARQRAQAEDLKQRANLPQPTGSTLR